MTNGKAEQGVAVLLLDIEGTTTPISFVVDRLFTYARAHLRDRSTLMHQTALAQLREEHAREPKGAGAPPWKGDESAADYAEWLMDRDVKSPGLKALQGLIWKVGYESGELHGEVFDDVPEAFVAARAAGVRIAIYSSGSVLAQRLLFGSTRFGDLTPQISAFFDTGVGPKREATSYTEIARRLECAPSSILFLSDIVAELEAARDAGCQVALVVRPGNAATIAVDGIPAVTRLTEIIG